MSWYSSVRDVPRMVDPSDGTDMFVDVATHGLEPWVRVCILNGANITAVDARKLGEALIEAADMIDARP